MYSCYQIREAVPVVNIEQFMPFLLSAAFLLYIVVLRRFELKRISFILIIETWGSIMGIQF